jgi:DNA-binding MarR family transcriptional regulator
MNATNAEKGRQQSGLEPEGSGNIADLPLDRRILRSLRRITRALEIHSRKLAANHQITGHQLVCLMMINDNGPITETSVARLSQLSNSTVVGILDRLEEKGLIKRERSMQDRRRVYVSVTAKGKRLATKGPSPLQDSLVAGLKELPDLEQAAIAMSLERIVDLMETPLTEKTAVGAGSAKKKKSAGKKQIGV